MRLKLFGCNAVLGMTIPELKTRFVPISMYTTVSDHAHCAGCILKMYSEETIPSFHECSPLLGFIMSKKQERLRSELLSEDKITNLLGFLTY